VVGLLAGLLPAAMLAGMRIEAAIRPARADTGIRSRSRWRWVAELAVQGLAAVSLYLLLSAGLGTGAGTDLLVAAAPLLLAAAACVLVLRLYPLPLRLLSRIFRRRPSVVGYLGSVRALRDPVVGVAPVLAVVAGVSVAVFSAVTLTTLTHGTQQAALSNLGAQLQVNGVTVTYAQYARIRSVPGVTAAARTMLVGSAPVQINDQPTQPFVNLNVADTAALTAVQRDVPAAIPVPAGMTGGPVPGAIVSTGLAPRGATLHFGTVTLRVLGSTDRLTGLGHAPDFVLVDSSVTGLGAFQPSSVLISTAPGADQRAIGAALNRILGPLATVQLASDSAVALQRGAIASGMRVALVGALIAASIAAIAALLLTMVLTTTARARLLAILRVLGLSVRQRRALVVWEQAPAAVVALVIGAGLGLGLAILVRATVDLAPFTGGRAQPSLFVGAGLLAALLGGFVVLVALATWIGLVATRRVTAATAVKLDEE
jgi:putative ABC transport system permease protein